MLFRRKKTSDNIRPLTGWKSFFYYFGLFILFPLRRPLITLLILLVLFLAPTFQGVKPVTVHKWYAEQISKTYNRVLVWWGSREPEVSPGEFKFHPEEAAPAPVTPSEFTIPEPMDKNAPNILDVLRGETSTEEKTQVQEEVVEEPKVEVKAEEKQQYQPEIVATPEEKEPEVKKKYSLPKDESLYFYPKEKKVYALKYLDIPHEITGKAIVHDCNEIEIDGEFILLYGIYVHPYTVQGSRATEYLKDLLEDKEVKCGIVAYTEQNIATGICYYNGENINRTMVIKGYTKNVAL